MPINMTTNRDEGEGYPPCQNPSCHSYGRSHPNCRCYAAAEGGEVSHFCSTDRMHDKGCEYYAEGGATPDAIDAFIQDPSNFQSSAPTKAPGPHETGAEQALTAIEGAGEGFAGPLAPLAETKLFGVNPEDIRAREEANPTAHGAGMAAGLVGGALTGTGEMGALAEVGSAAVKGAEAMGATSTAAKLAVKLGVENSLFTLGDQMSKVIKNDPNSTQAAVASVGLSGLIGAAGGGVLGKISEPWANKIGPKAQEFMSDFLNSMKGEIPVDEAGEALSSPGIKAGQKFTEYLGKAASEAVSTGIGGALGTMTRIPGAGWLGAYLGDKTIKPMVNTFLPAIAEKLLSSEPSLFGLKASFDTMDAILSGVHTIDKAADALFKTGSSKMLDSLVPDTDRLRHLDEKLSSLSQNPSDMMDLAGDMGYYMPSHQASVASTAQVAVNYLSSQKPRSIQLAPFDKPMDPTFAQKAEYQRTLQVAENPLSILSYVQKGTLRPKDLLTVKVLYPQLAPKIAQTVNNALISHMSKGNTVPYKMRSSLGLLLGQPLDSTFTPGAMMAAQGTFIQPMPPPQMGAKKPGKPEKGTSKLGASAKLTEMPSQARMEALLKP